MRANFSKFASLLSTRHSKQGAVVRESVVSGVELLEARQLMSVPAGAPALVKKASAPAPAVVTAKHHHHHHHVKSQPTFVGTDVVTNVGPGLIDVAVGDFNHDGKLDAVVSETPQTPGGSGLFLLQGKGDGTFAAPVAIGQAATRVAVGDFNGDGKLDVGFISEVDSRLFTVAGKGDGTFGAPQMVGIAEVTTGNGLVVRDVNRDGRDDLITTQVPNDALPYGGVEVLLGQSDGSFKIQTAGSIEATFPAVADVNGDGKADLVTSVSMGGGVTVQLGNGDGTFGAAKGSAGTGGLSFATGVGPIGDFNGDGKQDVILVVNGTAAGNSALYLALGKGNGTFKTPFALNANVGGAGNAALVKAADFNGDGKLDLAFATNDATVGGKKTVALLVGKGNGTFAAPVSYAAGSDVTAATVGDVNRDGKPDLVTLSATDGTLVVLTA